MAARKTTSQPPNPRRKRGFERAVTLVGPELRTPAEKRGFAETKLLTHWAEIVGTEIAEMALPVKVKYGRGFGGTLVVLTTGSRAPLLEMARATIIARVNACYGYSAIKDVIVTQTAPTGFAEGQVAFGVQVPKAARPAPDPARLAQATAGLDHIESADLRDALRKLAGHIISNETR